MLTPTQAPRMKNGAAIPIFQFSWLWLKNAICINISPCPFHPIIDNALNSKYYRAPSGIRIEASYDESLPPDTISSSGNSKFFYDCRTKLGDK